MSKKFYRLEIRFPVSELDSMKEWALIRRYKNKLDAEAALADLDSTDHPGCLHCEHRVVEETV